RAHDNGLLGWRGCGRSGRLLTLTLHRMKRGIFDPPRIFCHRLRPERPLAVAATKPRSPDAFAGTRRSSATSARLLQTDTERREPRHTLLNDFVAGRVAEPQVPLGPERAAGNGRHLLFVEQ